MKMKPRWNLGESEAQKKNWFRMKLVKDGSRRRCMRSRWIFLSSLFDVSLLWSEIYLILWEILLWEFHNFHPKLLQKIFVSFILEQSLCWLPIFLWILQFVRPMAGMQLEKFFSWVKSHKIVWFFCFCVSYSRICWQWMKNLRNQEKLLMLKAMEKWCNI